MKYEIPSDELIKKHARTMGRISDSPRPTLKDDIYTINQEKIDSRRKRTSRERELVRKADIEALVGFGFMGLVASGLVGANYAGKAVGLWGGAHQQSPLEKPGGHQGEVHTTPIGTGTLHTKSGDFHVSQK